MTRRKSHGYHGGLRVLRIFPILDSYVSSVDPMLDVGGPIFDSLLSAVLDVLWVIFPAAKTWALLLSLWLDPHLCYMLHFFLLHLE